MIASLIEHEVRTALHGRRVILAVSGGVDSMVLLHAAARTAATSVVAVATFDHGTGGPATRAARLVSNTAKILGFRCIASRAFLRLDGEAEWRTARWEFLNSAVTKFQDSGAVGKTVTIATAHSLNDHIETVFMRILRGSSAYGLSGLYARSDIVRPLLAVTRADIERYAEARQVVHIEDPTNASRAYLRNRVRLELLPALRQVAPDLDRELRAISIAAASVRGEMEKLAGALDVVRTPGVGFAVDLSPLKGLSAREVATLLPAIAARARVRLDRRGAARLSEFVASTLSPRKARRGRVQLSGGFEAEWLNGLLHFSTAKTSVASDPGEVLLSDGLRFGPFRFRLRLEPGMAPVSDNRWHLRLPVAGNATVRLWRAGDRMRPTGSAAPRRVKRFLSDAGVQGTPRALWPVVLLDDEIVWIPGVTTGSALPATERNGYLSWECEYHND